MKEILFKKEIPSLGRIAFREIDLEKDASIIHSWVNMPYAIYWGMMDTSLEEFKKAYTKVLSSGTKVYIGEYKGERKFLIEKYNVIKALEQYYNGKDGDIGMHILVGPPTKSIPLFTWHVFSSVMEFLFSDNTINRVIVEPDIRNEKIHILNKKSGFEYQKQIQLPHKTAWLATCTREQFSKALKGKS
ncbi:MAG TPA: GNAT family N-acetyltransferase [Chitinophagales bacterium]|nr:GNAT family N-acetyltransferase [Chitinophagales bacterium]